MKGLDWPGVMRAGMQRLQLRPDEFWRLTPWELALMLGEGGAASPLRRQDVTDLMRRWPDVPATKSGDKGANDG